MTAKNELRAEVEIDADPGSVWAVLMDFGAYPDWNPFIHADRGDPGGGSAGSDAPDPATRQPRDRR